jgi:hypothetical protein
MKSRVKLWCPGEGDVLIPFGRRKNAVEINEEAV